MSETIPLSVSSEAKDSYVIKLYDDTYGTFSKDQLVKQLDGLGVSKEEISNVIHVVNSGKSYKNANSKDTLKLKVNYKDFDKLFSISDVNYYGKTDNLGRTYVLSENLGELFIFDSKLIYNKKFDTLESSINEVNKLENMSIPEFISSTLDYEKTIGSDLNLKTESIESDAIKSSLEMVKNKIIKKSDIDKRTAEVFSDDEFVKSSKLVQVSDLKKGDLFYFSEDSSYHFTNQYLNKVIDVYQDKDDKGASNIYALAFVEYPHYNYQIIYQDGSDHVYVVPDENKSALKVALDSEVDTNEIYKDNPGVLKVGSLYTVPNYSNQVRKVLSIDSKYDTSADEGKYYFINYKIVKSDVKDEVGEKLTDVLSSNQVIHNIINENYDDVYIMSGTEAEARGNYSKKDRLDVMNRHKYTDYTPEERKSKEDEYKNSSSIFNTNIFSQSNIDDKNYSDDSNEKSGLHVKIIGNKNSVSDSNKGFIHTEISAPKSGFVLNVPLTSRFDPTVNNNVTYNRDKYKVD